MDETTLSHQLPPLPSYTLEPLQSLVPGIPDVWLCLALPVVAYWAVSLVFHLVDEWDLFPQYRLHTPAEVLKRNHVSRWDVLRDVVIQQIIQTIVGLGLTWFDPEQMVGKEEYDVAVWAQRVRIAQRAVPAVLGLVGVDAQSAATKLGGSGHTLLADALAGGVYSQQTTGNTFATWELQLASAIYYVGIPFMQFLLAICIVDTWQYFMHRAMHLNKWLYTAFHSRHHRLYVPYAYGALYNHPVEGLFMDTVGTGIAYLVSGMTVRQSMWFFTLSTIKTVDDHCGYVFPWDPLQHLTSNNAGYHDVHHQSWGIKTNFSQPFFTFWDAFLGTKWVGGDVSARYERARLNAQKKMDADAAPITASTPAESSAPVNAPYTDVSSGSNTPTPPSFPSGKATAQALSSRQQTLSTHPTAVTEETAEEAQAQVQREWDCRQSNKQPSPLTRKRGASSASGGLKDFAGRVGESLRGRSSGVLGVER